MSDPEVKQSDLNSTHPKIGIVLVNFNALEDTRACLKSLRSITYQNVAIVVVHNGCSDGSAETLATEFPEASHKASIGNLGFSGGNNLGIAVSFELGAEHILLLNNDTIVTPGFLEPLLSRLESDPTIGAVSGKIYYGPDVMNGRSNIIWYAGCFQKWHTGFHHSGVLEEDTGKFETAREVPYASGCMIMMRGELVKLIGGLSDDLFLYWEEADWCYTAREHGFSSWYEPESVIYHNFKSAHHGKEKPFYMYMQTRNAFIFAKRHYRGFMRLRFWSCYPIFLCYRFFSLRSMGNPVGARAIVWGVRDALRGMRGTTGLAERGFSV